MIDLFENGNLLTNPATLASFVLPAHLLILIDQLSALDLGLVATETREALTLRVAIYDFYRLPVSSGLCFELT